MKKMKKYRTNSFYHYANEYRKYATDENDIEKIDCTDMFWAELSVMIDEGELVNININAPPTSGKSVTGFAIATRLMKEKFNKEFGIMDIDRDQQEFSKTMRDATIKNTVRVIDEWNELELTGENSTIEQTLYNVFSDVMAQRFVHKISCSPKDTADKNALIFLQVESTDKRNKVNHCKLFYRIFFGGMEITQLLGFVDIYVGDVIKQQWYKDYRRRKFEKMHLILDEGIFQPRKLEYAKVIKEVVDKLKLLTRISMAINVNIVRNYIKIAARKYKIPQTILGEELATKDVLGILDFYKAMHRINRQVKKLEEMRAKGSIEEVDYELQKMDLEKINLQIIEAIKVQEMELENMEKINEKYSKMEE